MIVKDRNPGDRPIRPPKVIHVQKAETDPHVVNGVKHVGIIPSQDLLINALQTVPVPAGVVVNQPASKYAGPNLEYMQNFKNAYIGSKFVDQSTK